MVCGELHKDVNRWHLYRSAKSVTAMTQVNWTPIVILIDNQGKSHDHGEHWNVWIR